MQVYQEKVSELKEFSKNLNHKSKRYKDFGNEIEDILYQHQPKSSDPIRETTMVDGMEIDEVISTVDPITKGTIKNPVRNRICNHIYDKDSITEAIRISENKRVRCPTVGCSNKNSVKVTDLVEDRELKRKFMAMTQN